MATVYLARDVRHNRKVALKVLRPDLGAVLGVERFLSEIQVTANLHHPNLLPLFDSGEADGHLFYVMPFIEGESLRDRLDREKQLPIEDAIHIATSVASALDYAHRHNVIHRDLKPENILLHEDQPLVADFGIALAVSNAGGGRITQTGLSLGTPKYMSPEQATGDRVIDARTDVYSLGAVTYELLTGDPPHDGSSSQAIIARVLTENPRPIRTTRPHVPEHVEGAVEKALEKLPADRFATAREFSDALNGKVVVASRATTARLSATAAKKDAGRGAFVQRAMPWALAGLAATAAIAGWWKASTPAEERSPVRFVLNFEGAERAAVVVGGSPFAMSPDGKVLAWAGASGTGATTRLYVRLLSDLRAREIPGTEGAAQPFFSPDGKWIGYYKDPELRKVPVEGGPSVMLAKLSVVQGVSWGTSDQIIVSTENRLASVPAQGGSLRPLESTDSIFREHRRWPLALSDGKTVLYTSINPSGSGPASGVTTARIGVLSLSGNKARVTDLVGTSPLAVIDGRLIYASAAGGVMSVQFDPKSGKPSGMPAPAIDGALMGGGGSFKGSVSRSGSIAYVVGNATARLVLVGEGTEQPMLPDEGNYFFPRFSPDGRKIVLSVGTPAARDIWIYEISSNTMQKLTDEGTINDRPEWSPDGKRVIYRSNRNGIDALWWQPADLSGSATLLHADSMHGVWEGIISPDGRHLVMRFDGTRLYKEDLVYRSLSGDTSVKPFIVSPFLEAGPRFSPDGRWIAYMSVQSGAPHVYVTPFPGPGARHLVSTGSGGITPLWMPDGKRIVYVTGTQLIEATLTLEPVFAVTSRRVLNDSPIATQLVHANYDVSRDGKRFLLLRRTRDVSEVVVVHNWKHELRARMNAGRN